MKKVCSAWLLMLLVSHVYADEGMWMLKELDKQNLRKMNELGFNIPYDSLYSESKNSISDAVVIFGRGCTGIAVSEQGLIFTNHHCGFDAIQSQSSVDHDYLKNGFVSQRMEEELPIPGLTVRFLQKTVNVTDQIVPAISRFTDEFQRISAADSISDAICDSINKNPALYAEVKPFYCSNKYYLQVYEIFKDVRMVFAPPSSVGKFGDESDNWVWPRHTGDFSVFRVYADADNKPAAYDKANRPYKPRYVPEVSLQGYEEGDYAMTIGFPGSTDRYLSSWGVEQRIQRSNKPLIEVRGVKQAIWREAMQGSDEIRIKYASKYAGSSNYWKNSIGMNKGLARLDVVNRKRQQEAALTAWLEQHPDQKGKYSRILGLLKKGFEDTDKFVEANTYLVETLLQGAEIITLARTVQSIDSKLPADSFQMLLEQHVKPLYKDYEPALDRRVLAAMMKLAKQHIPADLLPDSYRAIDKKYKGDYERYAADLFKKTAFTSYDKVVAAASTPQKFKKLMKDPVAELSFSVMMAYFRLQQNMIEPKENIHRGERLYFMALKEMYPERLFYSDANFTMRMSYGSIGGYRPYDAAWYDYYTTQQGILEKQDTASAEYYVEPEILDMIRQKDFGRYGDGNGNMQLCFLSNNDITGGNSGSPVFDKNARLIGLAFDGNWEAMSGDIAFEPDLQRMISVDIRYVLYMIDKWGQCPRLIQELKLVD